LDPIERRPNPTDRIVDQTVLEALVAIIRDRRDHPPPRSYTTTLFAGGVAKIGSKIVEEAAEVVAAAAETGPDAKRHLIQESADLLYHLLVMLRYANIEWDELESELGRRLGVCGLDEKESRARAAPPTESRPGGGPGGGPVADLPGDRPPQNTEESG
jgi:phosphoribosyl-ATP pyrophosphohydrolase